MQCNVPGHSYYLEAFEESRQPAGEPREHMQSIQFIHKEAVDGKLVLIEDGTTNEEVLEVLIDRMKFLQDCVPCHENNVVIRNLEQSLVWLEKRTTARVIRCVEGTARR